MNIHVERVKCNAMSDWIMVELLQYILPYTVRKSLLMSPYLCFMSFLYLDLYVLGDNSWIS